MKRTFLRKFFPASRTAKVKNKISGMRQLLGDSLSIMRGLTSYAHLAQTTRSHYNC